MVADFYKGNPFRSPQWRAERASFLLANRQLPNGFDDKYIRAYRKLLILQKDNTGMGPFLEMPHAYVAASINNFPDTEWRDILQAKLLTEEEYEDIGHWLGIESEAVDFFEKVFFNVRDRMQHRGWIIKVILGAPEERESKRKNGQLTNSQRGVIYRLFAFYGGPEALEAAMSGFMPSALPSAKKDLEKWYDKALEQIIHTRAASAARMFEINKYNVMQVLELAVSNATQRQMASNSVGGGIEDFAEKVTGAMGRWNLVEQGFSKKADTEQHLLTGPVEARVHERIALSEDGSSESYEIDEGRLDKQRLVIQDQV